MNEERAGLWLRQTEHHRSTATQIISNGKLSYGGDLQTLRSDDLIPTTRNPGPAAYLSSEKL